VTGFPGGRVGTFEPDPSSSWTIVSETAACPVDLGEGGSEPDLPETTAPAIVVVQLLGDVDDARDDGVVVVLERFPPK